MQIKIAIAWYSPVTCRCDEIEHGMDPVVSEARITLDTRLLSQNIIVLPFEITNDLRETIWCTVSAKPNRSDTASAIVPGLIVDLVSKTRRVHDGQRDAGTLLVKLELCMPGQWLLCIMARQLFLRVPTVIGLILTPSSTWAALGSSDSLCPSTVFPQRVLTKVVRPVYSRETRSGLIRR